MNNSSSVLDKYSSSQQKLPQKRIFSLLGSVKSCTKSPVSSDSSFLLFDSNLKIKEVVTVEIGGRVG